MSMKEVKTIMKIQKMKNVDAYEFNKWREQAELEWQLDMNRLTKGYNENKLKSKDLIRRAAKSQKNKKADK